MRKGQLNHVSATYIYNIRHTTQLKLSVRVGWLRFSWEMAIFVRFLCRPVSVNVFLLLLGAEHFVQSDEIKTMSPSQNLSLVFLYSFILLFFVSCTSNLGSGPLWPLYQTEVEQCRQGWWHNICRHSIEAGGKGSHYLSCVHVVRTVDRISFLL